jgi:hypothetical protein
VNTAQDSAPVCSRVLSPLSHLVSYGFGTAPLQKNLLDAAGTGHTKALRTLQLGLGVHGLGPTERIRDRGQHDEPANMTDVVSPFALVSPQVYTSTLPLVRRWFSTIVKSPMRECASVENCNATRSMSFILYLIVIMDPH